MYIRLEESAFDYVINWIQDERQYTLDKFGVDQDHARVLQDNKNFSELNADLWWEQQLDNYWHRMKVLGLDSPNGRQALAKLVSTLTGMLSASVEVFGPLPEPGVPSGENLDNLRELL